MAICKKEFADRMAETVLSQDESIPPVLEVPYNSAVHNLTSPPYDFV